MGRPSTRQLRACRGLGILDQVERVILGAVAVVLVLGAAWGGYELGLRDNETPRERLLSDLQSMFDSERRALEAEKSATGEHLDALALKLGEIQARMLRLEALGERLVNAGKLDTEEFDFAASPAMGGPEYPGGLSVTLPDMVSDLNALAMRIEDREIKLGVLEDLLLHRQVREDSKPAGRPVDTGWISSRYGWRKDPFTGKKTLHKGLDFAGKPGAGIIAVADGVVSWADNKSGYGNTVEIRHGHGYVTRYAHNKKLLVVVGQLVRQGQDIAEMGHSGRATGTHLHFEVIRNGTTVNPLKFVKTERKAEPQG